MQSALEPSASAAKTKEQSDVLELWRRKNKVSSGVHQTAAVTRDVMKCQRVSNCHTPAAREQETTLTTEEEISTLNDG